MNIWKNSVNSKNNLMQKKQSSGKSMKKRGNNRI